MTELAKALLAFQKNAPHIPLDSTNPHFKNKYASLAGIWKEIRKPLSDAGLTVSQWPTEVEGNPALRTTLMHVSGESDSATMLLFLTKLDAQAQGSALTYARRYALLSVLGLVGDEDDDGEAATKARARQGTATPASAAPDKGKPAPAPAASSVAQASPTPDADAERIDFGDDAPHPEIAPEPQSFKTPKMDQDTFFSKLVTEGAKKDKQFVAKLRSYTNDQFGKTASKDMTKKEKSQTIDAIKDGAVADYPINESLIPEAAA